MPCVLPFFPDTVLMGRKYQCGENFVLEVAFSGLGCKDSEATAEDNVFEAESGALLLISSVLSRVY